MDSDGVMIGVSDVGREGVSFLLSPGVKDAERLITGPRTSWEGGWEDGADVWVTLGKGIRASGDTGFIDSPLSTPKLLLNILGTRTLAVAQTAPVA